MVVSAKTMRAAASRGTRANVSSKKTNSTPVKTRSSARGPVLLPAVKRQAKVEFGPVTTIDTAPVAIGNSYQGVAPIVIPIADGMRVKGRDYLITLDSALQLYLNDWTLLGGAPITPACMIASAVKGFNNTYAQYCIHAVAFHFITSSSTSHDGSVMLYIGKNRNLPLPDTSNTNFLPFVLSDHNTTISPAWKNSTSVYVPPQVWRSTAPFNDESLDEQSPGELMVYSKFNTNSTTVPASPGYIIVDYDISFRNMSLNIKNLTFPASRMKYNQVCLFRTNPALNELVEMTTDTGLRMDGSTSFMPTGVALGDIYKLTVNTDNKGGLTSYTGWWHVSLPIIGGSVSQAVVIHDGYTCYGTVNENNKIVLYPSYTSAMTQATPLLWSAVAASDYFFIAYLSLVGSVYNNLLQTNY